MSCLKVKSWTPCTIASWSGERSDRCAQTQSVLNICQTLMLCRLCMQEGYSASSPYIHLARCRREQIAALVCCCIQRHFHDGALCSFFAKLAVKHASMLKL